MGTSSMYGGYSNGSPNGNPLLPDDFEENENDTTVAVGDKNNEDENEKSHELKNKKITSWQSAKTSMSKIASGNSTTVNKTVSNYVKAYGGAKSASKTAKSGIATIINIGGFLNNVSEKGFQKTLEEYKIDYNDKSVNDVLSDIINLLAPTPVTKEDSIARKALIVTMEFLYERLDEESLELDKIDKETLNFIIPKYIECYIYERIINDLGSRIEKSSPSSIQAIEIEEEIKEYINSKVDIAFREKDFTTMNFNKVEVESLYNQCYTIMEDMI